MKKKFTLVLILLLFAVLLSGVISCRQKDEPTSQGGQASWAYDYQDMNELCADTSLIAVGVIDRVIEVIEKQEHLYFTRFAFRIEKVLKGEEVEEVVLNHTGAADKPGSDILDDPLFEVGERYLLFLKINTPGIYFHPGPQARYKIVNDKVYSMNHILKEGLYYAPEELDFNGLELDVFIDDFIEILSKTLNYLFIHPLTISSSSLRLVTCPSSIAS